MKQKLMFLYLKTGGGHLSPARSVAQWIEQNHDNGYKVELVDGFTGVNSIVKLIVEDGYRKSQEKATWVFESLYAIHKLKPIAHLSGWLVSKFVTPILERRILADKPDKIVIFHFFLIKPINEILKRNNLNIPMLTVVTDPFTAHPIWFLDKTQNFIVFSQQLKNHLINTKKIPADNINTFPFILNDKFSSTINDEAKAQIKATLRIPVDSKVILIMGGADGIPKGAKILKRLLQSALNAHIVIVCGRNENLLNQANKLKLKHSAEQLHVFGFVNIVYELLNIADLVITKCGASTFMEVLMCGKIPLINSYIWEQEKGNVEYICNNQLGHYEKKVNQIPILVKGLVFNESKQGFYKNNINRLKLINGTSQVSTFIMQYS
ncbi:MAG TPA: hypothetical protein DIW31_01890 [Bacteroidales bacterium]|nr:hypothetical protein [Bacteroidales bacterium]